MGCCKTNTKENIINKPKINYNENNFILDKNEETRFTYLNKKNNQRNLTQKINENKFNTIKLNLNSIKSVEESTDEFEKKPPTKERVKIRITKKKKKNLEELLIKGHYDSYEIEKNNLNNSINII